MITPWIKSAKSSGEGQCVEARQNGPARQVRDSKDPQGPVLTLRPEAYAAWIAAAKAGELDGLK
jgi:hypothetical protein